MDSPLISILIPFYNEEKHIKRALLSALNQTYSNIEIILIDDYSTDNSIKIIEEIIKKNSNIIIVTSKNKGIGSARNTGLGLIKGEYFAFLDADDELSVNFIEVCCNNIITYNSDISIVNTKVYDLKTKEINTDTPDIKKNVLSGFEVLKKVYSFQIIASVWGKLFKSSLIIDIQFNEDFIFEDKPFLVEVLLRTNQIHLSNEKLYFHFANPNSISRKVINPPRINDSTSSFIAETEILSKNNRKNFLLPLSFNYQYFIMLDLFFLMNIDKKRIDTKSITSVYLDNMKRIKNQAISKGIKPKGKKRVLLIILGSIKTIGWNIPFVILKNYFQNHFEFIKKIKQ